MALFQELLLPHSKNILAPIFTPSLPDLLPSQTTGLYTHAWVGSG